MPIDDDDDLSGDEMEGCLKLVLWELVIRAGGSITVDCPEDGGGSFHVVVSADGAITVETVPEMHS